MPSYEAVVHALLAQSRRATPAKVHRATGGPFSAVLDYFAYEMGRNMTPYDNLARVTDEIEVAIVAPRPDKDTLTALIDESKALWLKVNQSMMGLAARQGDAAVIVQHSDLLNKATSATNSARTRLPGAMVGG